MSELLHLPILHGALLLGLVALLCGATAASLGRRLILEKDAPDLFERLQRHRQRMVLLLVGTLATLPFLLALAWRELPGAGLLPRVVAVAFPVLGLAILAGNFRIRREILGETWGFLEYLGFGIRIWLGLLGFWILILATPFLVHGAGANRLWAAAGLGVLLWTWLLAYRRVATWVLRARPLEDPALRERFAEVSGRARAPEPEVLVCGPEGGGIHNAAALPHATRPQVLFTRPLLGRIAPDEATAIFAHEVAHLEEWDRARLRRQAILAGVLVTAAPLVTPGAAWLAPDVAQWTPLAWLVALLVILSRRAAGNRQHETESDLRAVELCGDPDAMKRALIQLHAANGMPRRWRADMEQMSTHPSLARRLQAIDRAHPPAPSPAQEDGGDDAPPLLRVRGKPGEAVLLEPDRIHWLAGVPDGVDDPVAARDEAASRVSLAYGELVELQLETGFRGPHLRSQSCAGETRSVPLHPDDVAPVQARLDRVDGLLAPLRRRPRVPHGVVAAAAFSAAIFSFPLSMSGSLSATVALMLLCLALAVMLRRRRTALAALAVMSLVAGVATLAAGLDPGWRPPHEWGFALASVLAALWCLLLVRRSSAAGDGEPADLPTGSPGRAAAILALLGLPGLVLFLGVASGPDPGPQLYAVGLYSGHMLLLFAGAGGALWLAGGRAARAGAALLVLVGVAPLLLGTRTFLLHAADDPWIADVPEIALSDATLPLRSGLGGDPGVWLWGLRVAPEGTAVAARSADAGGSHFWLATPDDAPQRLEALDLVFRDAEHALLLVQREERLELRLHRLGDLATPVWSRVVVPAAFDDCRLSAGADSWQVGCRLVLGDLLQFRGHFGSGFDAGADAGFGAGPVAPRTWPEAGDPDVHRIAGAAPHALEFSWGPDLRGPGGSWRRVLWLLGPQRRLMATHWLGEDGTREAALGRSALGASCAEPPDAGARTLCLATDRAGTWLWDLDLTGRRLAPLARLPAGQAWSWDGRRLAQLAGDALHLVDPAAGRGQRIALPRSAGWQSEVSVAPGVVAVSWPDREGDGTRIAVFAAP